MSMAWLAVDKNGDEYVYSCKPYRDCCKGLELWMSDGDCVYLPQGFIKKLIGRELTWNDEPVELK